MLVLSCSTKTSSSENVDASNDSLEAVYADSSVIDQQESEELSNVVPTEVLSLKPGKKNLSFVDESDYKNGTWPLEVTNTSSVPVKGSDYKIEYVEVVEEWVGSDEDGGFDDVSHTRTVPGIDIAPNETVTIVLKSGKGCQDLKSPKIVNAS